MLEQAREGGTAVSVEDLNLDAATLARLRDDVAELERPPVSLTDEARQSLSLLVGLGMVAPVVSQDTDGPGLFVHRWTAAALRTRTSPAELTDAHRKAAAYWRWRVAVWPQTQAEDVEQTIEARYHYHAAGDLDDALDANAQACSQLRTWGAWTTERQLQEEALGWVPPRSSHAARIRFHLGALAQYRGDYSIAEEHHQASLAISEEIGDRAGIAIAYHQLATLAHRRGDYGIAEERYHAALAIFEEIGDRANSYHELGMLARDRRDYDTAEQRYQAALAIKEEIGDRAAIARTLSQIGVLRTDQGRPADAISYQIQSLAIRTELGSSEVAIDVRMLGQQRAALGDQQFQRTLRTLMDAHDAIMQLTEQAG